MRATATVALFAVSLNVAESGAPEPSKAPIKNVFPVGWTGFELPGNKGHTFFKTFCERKTYAEAQAGCAALGGHLANIHTKEENDVVRLMIGGTDSFWIGLRQVDGIRGRWRWQTKPDRAGAAIVTYHQWNNYRGWGHEPDNNRFVGSDGECVVMGWCNDHDRSWVDVDCNATAPYVCEREYGQGNFAETKADDTNYDGALECQTGTADLGQWKGCHLLDVGAFVAIVVSCFIVFVAIVVAIVMWAMGCFSGGADSGAAEGGDDAADGGETNEPTKEGEVAETKKPGDI